MALLNKRKTGPQDASRLLGLIQRLSLAPHTNPIRIITFVAARPNEGTSTVAKDYAEALTNQTGQKVLLIDAGPLVIKRFQSYGADPHLGIVDERLAGKLTQNAIYAVRPGFSVGRWIGREESRGLSGQTLHSSEFWEQLAGAYDTVVIDAPSLQSSFEGVMLAARSDATVMVVEAERTPEPVITNLRNTLTASGAKIMGMVMNKRRYYIPGRVYKRL